MTKKRKIELEGSEFGVDSRYTSKADAQALMAARLERMKNLSEDDILRAKLVQLKLKMEDYLKNPVCNDYNFFTESLTSYIDTVYSKRSAFASDIDITPVRLSQVLNNHRDPHDDFMLRLMVHSERTYQNVCDFPQKTWYQVYYQEKICDTMINEDEWRPEVEKHVKMKYTKKKK